jgi:CheY-like chemotaxis protein
VEDNPADVVLIREALRDYGIAIDLSVAIDGREALDFLHKSAPLRMAQRPDLILLDLNLPKIGGFEVLAVLKADPALREIPVIVLTSSGAPSDIDRAYSLAANCFLRKPVTLDEYLEQITSMLDFWLGHAILPSRVA